MVSAQGGKLEDVKKDGLSRYQVGDPSVLRDAKLTFDSKRQAEGSC